MVGAPAVCLAAGVLLLLVQRALVQPSRDRSAAGRVAGLPAWLAALLCIVVDVVSACAAGQVLLGWLTSAAGTVG
jgi:hypothetical protein